MSPQFYGVHFIDGLPTVKLTDFAKIVNYSDSTLLGIFKNLKEKDIDLAYKWKRNWYIFLPSPTIKEVELPSGQTIEVNWARAAQESPELVFKLSNVWFLNRFLTSDDQLFVVGPEPLSDTKFTSSTLSPKKGTPFIHR